eukprot:GDKJ01012405.1.p1 GENE.GDKJ01012405.1~~GDKJ01012405.1.p1  ORF type:complete len:405 (-),score=109.86 GDKJ01012405.1:2140-3354(-)
MQNSCDNKTRGFTKIYVDGVFDLTHSGHFNALRQASLLGDKLICGVVSDEEATKAKGAPVFNEQERAEMVKACKWVEEAYIGAPYAVSSEFLKQMDCDYVAHGDDFAPCADGSDCYAEPRAEGKLKIFRRTEGISTTDIVSRLLAVSAVNPSGRNSALSITGPSCSKLESPSASPVHVAQDLSTVGSVADLKLLGTLTPQATPVVGASSLLMTSRRLLQFMNGGRQPKSTDRVIYIDGFFDVLHIGHVRALQAARARGDFLLVGIHDDSVVERAKGYGFPILNTLERTLAVLALRCVDEVIIGAPWVISEYLLKTFNVAEVISCNVDELAGDGVDIGSGDRFVVPKSMGIHHNIESDASVTTEAIVKRIAGNDALASTINKRKAKQDKHYSGIVDGLQQQVLEL